MSQVNFPIMSTVDEKRNLVTLPVVIDDESSVWLITEPAMHANFGVVPLHHLSILLEKHRPQIEHAILRKIGEGARGSKTLNRDELTRLLS